MTDAFTVAWESARKKWATAPERRARRRKGAASKDSAAGDPTADWLEANWETYGSDGEKLFTLCPWKDGHSGDSGETEAAWMLAGTGGYARGHFVCLHASCSGRSDAAFFKAVGMPTANKADFRPVAFKEPDPLAAYLAAAATLPVAAKQGSTKVKAAASHPHGKATLPLPGFERDRNGLILATLGNVVRGLQYSQMTGYSLRYDTFRGELVIVEEDGGDWRPFRDADVGKLRIALAEAPHPHTFEQIGKEMMRDALAVVAADSAFDSAVHWLINVVPQWDGVPRLERLFPDYFGTEDTPYTRACGLYVMTAHASRIMEPGCQADMAPILLGAQGLRKSSGVAAISPDPLSFKKFDVLAKDADQSRKMRGVLVGEFDEMRGLNGRGAEEIRSFMTKRWEDWTPKYQEYETKFARRLIFWGTGNEDEILNDPTGERRWLPMRVHRMVDVNRIKADCLQLWAEGFAQWLGYGVRWQEAERLAKLEHAAFKITDPWDADVARWLAETDVGKKTHLQRGNVRSADVLVGALGFDVGRVTRADEMRMSRVLTGMGLRKEITKINGKTARVWVAP